MPGVNLTRVEANERSALIKVDSYDIDLDLTLGAETFISKTTVKFSSLKPGATTFIDAVGKKSLPQRSMAHHLMLPIMTAKRFISRPWPQLRNSFLRSKASTQNLAKAYIASLILPTMRSISIRNLQLPMHVKLSLLLRPARSQSYLCIYYPRARALGSYFK